MIKVKPIILIKWRLRGFSRKEIYQYLKEGISLIEALRRKQNSKSFND